MSRKRVRWATTVWPRKNRELARVGSLKKRVLPGQVALLARR